MNNAKTIQHLKEKYRNNMNDFYFFDDKIKELDKQIQDLKEQLSTYQDEKNYSEKQMKNYLEMLNELGVNSWEV